ncbi:MAG: Mrp/NBP35 family ATP-binding protein [Candidatus Ranarchaeia archaeon]
MKPAKTDNRTTHKNVSSQQTPQKQDAQKELLSVRMNQIKYKLAIMSGKGGVGKTTVTVNMASVLAGQGYSVGVLDADIHGSCVPQMLGVEGSRPAAGPPGIFPVKGPLDIRVVSVNFFLPEGDAPVIWRGPLKMGAIRQFLTDIVWGKLDFLLVDLPPGTGDEPLSIMQLIPSFDGVVIVTAPSEVSQLVVRKAINMAKKMRSPVLGIIENMSEYICPHCGERVNIFGHGGGNLIAEKMNVPFLGSLPIDPTVCYDCDAGEPYVINNPDKELTKKFTEIVELIKKNLNVKPGSTKS